MAITSMGSTPVAIVGSDTFMATIKLSNGEALEIALRVQDVVKIDGVVNADGSPRYDFKSGISARVVAPVKAAANG